MIVGLIGLVITATVTWTAWTLNRNNEHRLLQVQTRQAAALLASTILSITDPLTTSLQIAATSARGARQFDRYMSAYVGPGRLFVSASLWKRTDPASVPTPVATVGVAPALSPTSGTAQAFATGAFHSTTFLVMSVRAGDQQRIAYAIAGPTGPTGPAGPTFAVYAERAIPANRRVPVESNSAFADLNYATYLGPTTSAAALATTDLPPSQLPLAGEVARVAIPFGDTSLTLVAAPREELGGTLGADLPWIFLVGGVAITLASALIAYQLVRRRRDAEKDARTISGLYDELDGLYGEQRSIADTLQQALLPRFNPSIPDVEIASRYVAGVDRVDIGGDWYTIVRIDEHHFGFVVGDVSGRGVGAAAVMARLRFTIRAYLMEGHPPDVVLAMCSRQLDVSAEGHFATALVGVADLRTRRITLANAGHLTPLIVSPTEVGFVDTVTGPPLGVDAVAYQPRSVVMAPATTLVAFTDGLVERRQESIDVGLDRLARVASTPTATVDGLVDRVVDELTDSGSRDDIAVLAFRWRAVGGLG